MKESQKLNKQKKSGVCIFIQIVIALTILMGLIVGLTYYFGAQQIHTDIPHALDQIFGSKKQKDLIAQLQTKSYQYSALWGANQTGIFQFLEHYADTRASKGSLVIVRRVQNNLYETALKFIRYTKNYIEENIDLQSDSQKSEWIFVVKNDQVPNDQIERIKSKRPKDRIIIGTTKKLPALKGFKKIQYPALKIADIKDVIVQNFGVSAKVAAILTNYYITIPQILHHLDEIGFSQEKHLGQYFQSLKDLGPKQIKTLKALCKDGSAPLQGNKNALQQFGAVTYNNVVYWDQRIRKLNYELSQQIQCVDRVVAPQIREKIQQQRREKQQAEAQAENQQNDQVKAKTTQSKTSQKQKKSTNKNTKQQSKYSKKSQKSEKVEKVKKEKIEEKASSNKKQSTKSKSK